MIPASWDDERVIRLSRRSWIVGLVSRLRAAGSDAVVVVVDAAHPSAPLPFEGEVVQFNRAYTACPVTEPSRRSIANGRFPHSGVGPGPSQVRLATLDQIRDLPPSSLLLFTSCTGLEARDEPGEGSVHVPLAIRYPKLFPKGRTEDFLISTIDIAPTLLGLQRLEVPAELQGRDLSELLTTGKGNRPESVFCEGKLGTTAEWRMLVRGLDKIVVNRNFEVTHLYNLGQDPAETTNLASDSSSELRRNELKALLRQWLRKTEDRMDSSGLKRRDR